MNEIEIRYYEVVSRCVQFGAGAALALDDVQAAARAHLISDTAVDGLYIAEGPVEFKRGERIGYAGVLPKALAADLSAAAGDEAPSGRRRAARQAPAAAA